MASHQPRKRLSFNQQRALTAPDQPAEIFAKQRLYFQGNPLTSVLNERSDSSAGGKRPSSRGSEILMSQAGRLVPLPCLQREQQPRSQADLFISNSCFAFRNDLDLCVHTGYRYTWFLFAPIHSPPGGWCNGGSSRDLGNRAELLPAGTRSNNRSPASPENPTGTSVSCTGRGCAHLPPSSTGRRVPQSRDFDQRKH